MKITKIGNYRIEKELGKGSFGTVYKAIDVNNSDLQVAVKVSRRERLEKGGGLKALESECVQLDALDHPNIVRFKHLIVEDDVVGIVLEYLEGQDLRSLIKSKGKLSLEEVFQYGNGLLAGLSYAHAKGLIHRDIKPSNVFICSDGRVKILDFGIAKTIDSLSVDESQIHGTPKYISPEVWLVNQVSPKMDIYAFGLVVWEMLMGQPACPFKNYKDVCNWHISIGAESLRTKRPDCSLQLERLILRTTSKNPDTRPQSAEVLSQLWAEALGKPSTRTNQRNMKSDDVDLQDFDWGVDATEANLAVGMGLETTTTRTNAKSFQQSSRPKYQFDEELWNRRRKERDRWNPLQLIVITAVVLCFIIFQYRKDSPIESEIEPQEVIENVAEKTKPIETTSPKIVQWSLVNGKTFKMGAILGASNAKPRHEVVLSYDFQMMKTEVTQSEYKSLMQKNPSYFQDCGDDCPVEWVTWREAAAYANAYSKSQNLESCYVLVRDRVSWPKGLNCKGWRLPTEAEWELAARSSKPLTVQSNIELSNDDDDIIYFAGSNDADDVAWYKQNSDNKTHPVCTKEPNHLGICDLSGNVAEWVYDGYARYTSEKKTDPLGPLRSETRIYRGGSWKDSDSNLQITKRSSREIDYQESYLGIRLVRTATPSQ